MNMPVDFPAFSIYLPDLALAKLPFLEPFGEEGSHFNTFPARDMSTPPPRGVSFLFMSE
jgi:hypothetical protein